jgi:hypothetical protein
MDLTDAAIEEALRDRDIEGRVELVIFEILGCNCSVALGAGPYTLEVD